MLLHRTLELAPLAPTHLRGSIQFELGTERGEVAFYHLILAGARTSGGSGAIEHANTRVRSDDAKLHALLFAKNPPPDALLVSGDASLLRSLLDHLKKSSAPKSLLKLRCQP